MKAAPPQLVTMKEAGKILGRTAETVRDMCKAGKLPYVQDGPSARIYVDVRDLQAYVDRVKNCAA
ncbi:MAG TPA: helix-turn-helix domain-containing protein [Thermodesulfobacteriota bacterium]|nr:helix-turn-helix domain-containing protein [Thermodesulfobacteriota bacterium]HNU72833.1 helix-turn-helix domain-containing protein [Thermodesulfobacteriota bacterium]